MFPLPENVLGWESWQSSYGFSNFTSGWSECMHPTQQMHHIWWKQDEKYFSIFIPATTNFEHHLIQTSSFVPSAPPSIWQANALDGVKNCDKQSWLYITRNLFWALKRAPCYFWPHLLFLTVVAWAMRSFCAKGFLQKRKPPFRLSPSFLALRTSHPNWESESSPPPSSGSVDIYSSW